MKNTRNNSNFKALAVVQARLGSTRLPSKVLKEIHGTELLNWLLKRICGLKYLTDVLVAKTNEKEDDILQDWIKANTGVSVFRGDTQNVLKRFFDCCQSENPDLIVRITADDPLKDPRIIDEMIQEMLNDSNLDYISNTVEASFPDGLDIEVFTYKALKKAYNEASLASEFEHVTPYIWKNKNIFKVKQLVNERDLSKWRWTVDTQEDLDFIIRITEPFKDNLLVHFEEIIEWIDKNPEVMDINQGHQKNEAYFKQVKTEKKYE
jgi:spore coat polysaccharide biosynthesis protein SpsF